MCSKRNSFLKPTSVLAVCVSLALLPARAGNIETDMQHMFENMGSSANYTKAGSFHNQAMNMYTGGALTIRSPISNLSPVHIQLPKIEAGCGGIDFFAGSFSFVNKEQFVQFTRNLGNNAAGVAFEIALDALDPLVGGAIGKIRAIADQVNRFNLNSCQTAKTLVGGVMGAAGESISKQCKASAVSDGSASDGSDSSFYCQYANHLAEQGRKAAGDPDQMLNSSISFTGGNLMHQAISSYFNISDNEDIDFMTSLTGTLVVKPIKADGNSKLTYNSEFLPPTITNVKSLIFGNDGANAEDKKVTVSLLVCTKGADKLWDECSKQNTQISSVRYSIKQTMQNLIESIQGNNELSTADQDRVIALINNTQLPILKIAINDAMLGTNLSEKYIDVITIEYMANYLAKLERGVRGALGRYKKFDNAAKPDIEKMYKSMSELRITLMTERTSAYAKASAEDAIVSYLKNFDSHWRANFPGVANNLAFDANHRLGG